MIKLGFECKSKSNGNDSFETPWKLCGDAGLLLLMAFLFFSVPGALLEHFTDAT